MYSRMGTPTDIDESPWAWTGALGLTIFAALLSPATSSSSMLEADAAAAAGQDARREPLSGLTQDRHSLRSNLAGEMSCGGSDIVSLRASRSNSRFRPKGWPDCGRTIARSERLFGVIDVGDDSDEAGTSGASDGEAVGLLAPASGSARTRTCASARRPSLWRPSVQSVHR